MYISFEIFDVVVCIPSGLSVEGCTSSESTCLFSSYLVLVVTSPFLMVAENPVREYVHHLLENCCVGLTHVFTGKGYRSDVVLQKSRFTSIDDIAKANIIRQRCKDLLDMNSHPV